MSAGVKLDYEDYNWIMTGLHILALV